MPINSYDGDNAIRGNRRNLHIFEDIMTIEDKIIKDYDFIPEKFNFNKIKNEENLFMGIELEVDEGGENSENASICQEIIGEENAYIMHDGSLRDGFEITTHPCTFEYHNSAMKYKELFQFLSKKGYRCNKNESCGLHVHVGRKYLGETNIDIDLNTIKIMFLIKKFWSDIKIITRRDFFYYSRNVFLGDEESILQLYSISKMQGKYSFINVQHKDTIEFRMFKGTLNYVTFMATLEFVRNIVDYCKGVDIKEIEKVENFDDILNINKNIYLNDYYYTKKADLERKERKNKSNYFGYLINRINHNNDNWNYTSHISQRYI